MLNFLGTIFRVQKSLKLDVSMTSLMRVSSSIHYWAYDRRPPTPVVRLTCPKVTPVT